MMSLVFSSMSASLFDAAAAEVVVIRIYNWLASYSRDCFDARTFFGDLKYE
jgi:hypothetical protein